MADLKPCPFCGGEAMIVYDAVRKSTNKGGSIKGTCIFCNNCTVELFYDSTKLAIDAWNRRAEQTPVVHGHWIVTTNIRYTQGICSRCGMVQRAGYLNYCPKCGAKMDEEDKHD